jgi:hypothetical protein
MNKNCFAAISWHFCFYIMHPRWCWNFPADVEKGHLMCFLFQEISELRS